MAMFFGKHKHQDQTKLYKDISKDIKKIHNQEKHHKYDPHHRKESISTNLPSNLKHYSNTIYIVNEFWLNNIKILNDEQLNQLAMSIYCDLYTQSTPTSRQLLLKSNKMNIPSHIIKIFTIFEYSLCQMIDSNTDAHNKLFKQLQAIGELHKNYLKSDDIDCDMYPLIINAFNHAMEHKFSKIFTVETKLCFNQFFRLIIDIMYGNDVYVSQHFKQIDIFLQSLQHCLCNEYGSLYFKKYLEQQFCVENYLFYKEVQKYKSVPSNQRIKIGRNLIDEFIKKKSEKQVNIRGSTREEIINIIELTTNMSTETVDNINISDIINVDITDFVHSVGFTEHLFNKAQEEIYKLMIRNNWSTFRNEILEYCENDNFEKQQRDKLKDKQQKDKRKRELVVAIIALKGVNDEKRQSEIDMLKEKNNKLEKKVLSLKNNLKSDNSEIDSLKQNNDELQQEIENEKQEIEHEKHEIDVLKERNSKLEQEVMNLKQNENEIDVLTQNNLKLQQEIIDLKESNDMKMDKLKQDNIKLQNKIMNLQQNEETLIVSKITLIKSTSTEIDNLRSKIKVYTKEISKNLTNV
eukprot:439197_1